MTEPLLLAPPAGTHRVTLRPPVPYASPARARALTIFWATMFLLQEVALPMSGTADHSTRTLAPFLLMANPAWVITCGFLGVLVLGLHNFALHSNLLVSLVVLLMPFALLSVQRTRLDPERFAHTVITALFLACLVQALLPGLSNRLFAPFIDGYLSFDQPFSRATGFSMEPSFAAEMLFVAAMIHLFCRPRLRSPMTLLIIGALLLIRAGTSVQQAVLFAMVYLFLKALALAAPEPARRSRAHLVIAILAGLFALCAILFGYSLLTYGTLDLSFIRDSMDRFNSWRTLSSYAAYLDAEPISFFPHDSNAGWAQAISGTLRQHGLTGDEWVTQPFSLIGVAFLDLGVAGAVLWVVAVCAASVRRLRRHALCSVQLAVVYTLLVNTIFLAPKWQLSGFLAIALLATSADRAAWHGQQAGDSAPGPVR